jgi:hypothetical protein
VSTARRRVQRPRGWDERLGWDARGKRCRGHHSACVYKVDVDVCGLVWSGLSTQRAASFPRPREVRGHGTATGWHGGRRKQQVVLVR